jgi:hypothetical protein
MEVLRAIFLHLKSDGKLISGPTPIRGSAWKGNITKGMFRTLYKAGLPLPTALYVLLLFLTFRGDCLVLNEVISRIESL